MPLFCECFRAQHRFRAIPWCLMITDRHLPIPNRSRYFAIFSEQGAWPEMRCKPDVAFISSEPRVVKNTVLREDNATWTGSCNLEMSSLEYTLQCGIYSAFLLLLLLLLLFSFLPGDWMFGDCGRRGLYIWKASDLTPEVIGPGQLKVHVCFQQQLCKLLLPWLCRAYVKIPQRQCPLCEPRALLIPGNSNPSFKKKWA